MSTLPKALPPEPQSGIESGIKTFKGKWDLVSASLRMARDLDLCRAREPSIAWAKLFNVRELVKESFSLDLPMVDLEHQICHRISFSYPSISKIDIRTRFWTPESASLRSHLRTNPLTTFQLLYDRRSGFGISSYKHISVWPFSASKSGRDLLNEVNKRNGWVTMKTVYEYPRTPKESIVPLATVAPCIRQEAFDPRVLSVHQKLYEATTSKYLSASRNSTSIDTLMDVAFCTADQDQSSETLTTQSRAQTISGQRTRSEYESSEIPKMSLIRKSGAYPKVYIALGSNMGDRCNWIERACKEMAKGGIKVIRTSALYETEAMYVKEQDSFLNGVCEVETNSSPSELLSKLKGIENRLGRRKTVDKGPRNIDLDILLYDKEIVNREDLCIPHKSMLEREFVLRPLCDLIPNQTLPAHEITATFKAHLENLPRPATPLLPLTPLAPFLPPITSLSATRKTHLMAILNLTPDSFSDGDVHKPDPTTLLPTLNSFLSSGATILDIGGQSTRPHAPQVSSAEELLRILPTINSIRSSQAFNSLALSIDTYRASVAAAAIEAGANIINDVSAGVMDPEMLPTVAKFGCTVILMHMRGTPDTMTSLTSYPSGIIHGVATELLARVRAAEAAGIFRWRIILDPGIGFAKTQAQNLELLRRFDELRDWEGLRGFPWCVGTSRKGFIGKITEVGEARERIMGTAACVTAAVRGGADVVRVHDVREMREVVRMGEAIWRV
ncbi:MAG: hypothetical protein Q9187_003724 [Circinaria calcarea]